jgi:hypothetical protein
MPISAPDLQALGKVSLDDYMRKTVVDQIAVETPLLKKLMSRRKLFLGAKQNVTVNVRKSHDSNFAWAYGEAAVGFNKRNTTDQAAFPWRRAVDGFYIPHDTLFGNGIKVREGERGQYKLETEERVQLVQLLDEQMEAFRTGFMEKLSLELHRDGTSSTDAVTGLDGLITTGPATGIVAGIDRATATYWRNNAATGIAATTPGALAQKMEEQWRRCIRTGGAPDFILAGSAFIDAYRQYGISGITQNADAGGVKKLDAGTGSGVSTGLYFKGVEIIWDPQFETLDTLDAPVIPWEKHCYFLNTKHIELRDDDMDIVSPTRPYNVLALYQMINLRLALVLKKSNAHSVLAIA